MGFMRTAIEHEPRITRYRARLDSLIGDASCGGAAFSGGLTIIAGATVLATGGYAGLYGRTTNSRISNGKGILEAARAGARVADPEFVQFHPTVFDGPESFLITEALRGAGIVCAGGMRRERGRSTMPSNGSCARRRGSTRADAIPVLGASGRNPGKSGGDAFRVRRNPTV